MASEASPFDSTVDASLKFVGKWHTLVSTTNWDKGKIICQWRQSLVDSDANSREYADEAWTRLVGGVTPQHVGRLRRVYERFGDKHPSYQGLYWSHFFAALDWDDAEMWLEGAVQNGWSVSQLRRQRWETLGSLPENEPNVHGFTDTETDEDFESLEDEVVAPTISGSVEPVLDLDAADEFDQQGKSADKTSSTAKENASNKSPRSSASKESSASIYAEEDQNTVSFVQSFAKLSELPEDLSEAFESFKLAILRHKLSAWADVSREDVLASLDALKELASTPVTESMPS